MPYMHMLSDPGMNYTLNRPLLDGTSAARITESGAVAPQIKDYESWHAVWLGLAKGAEAEKRWIDAALSVEALPTLSALFIEAMRALDLTRYKSFADVDAALAPEVSSEPSHQFLLKNLTRDENGRLRWKIHLEAIHRN